MKIFVTGGTGFIGKHVIEKLLQLGGYEIIVLTRQAVDSHNGALYLKGDLSDKKIINEITKDTIIHVHSIWTYPSYAGYKISKDFGVPLVVSVRGTMYKWAMNKSKYVKLVAMWLYQRRILNYANKIHITEIGEKEAMENIGIFNDKMLVPDGVSIGNKPDDLNKKILI